MPVAGVVCKKLSDHYFTVCVAMLDNIAAENKNDKKEITILDNKNVDKLISEFDWNSLEHLLHTRIYETMVGVFSNIYKNSQKTIRLKQRSVGKVWINSDILELCRLKDKLWTRCKQNPGNQSLKDEFRSVRNKLTDKLRFAKRSYHKEKFNNTKGNAKAAWNLVNELTGKETKTSIDDTIARNFGESANWVSLCETFSNKFATDVEEFKAKMNFQQQTGLSNLAHNLESAYLSSMTEADLRCIIYFFLFICKYCAPFWALYRSGTSVVIHAMLYTFLNTSYISYDLKNRTGTHHATQAINESNQEKNTSFTHS